MEEDLSYFIPQQSEPNPDSVFLGKYFICDHIEKVTQCPASPCSRPSGEPDHAHPCCNEHNPGRDQSDADARLFRLQHVCLRTLRARLAVRQR